MSKGDNAPYLYARADEIRELIIGKTYTIERPITGTKEKRAKGAQPEAKIKSKSGKLDVSHLGVFLLIAAHMDANKGAYPSLKELGELGQRDPRTIGDKVEELEAADLIEVIRSKKPDGSNDVNRYRIKANFSISQYEKRYEHPAITMYRAMLGGDPTEGYVKAIAEMNPNLREWGGTLEEAQQHGLTADQAQQVIALYRANLKNSIQPSNTQQAAQAQPKAAPVKDEAKAPAPVTPVSVQTEGQFREEVEPPEEATRPIRHRAMLRAKSPVSTETPYQEPGKTAADIARNYGKKKDERPTRQRQAFDG